MIHDWTRFWTKPDGEISLADQGFLVGPTAEHWLAPLSGDLWPFEEIAERRCLILLGEPGMGKSETLATGFEVTGDGLREVLGSGLFSARGDDLGWAHQTYGEYLAARYLTGTEMTLEQMLALLVADAEDGRVVPQLRDVAGWTAAMDPEFLDELVARDPLVLLRGDIGSADDDQKARLAKGLLTTRAAEELDPWDARNRRNLRALAYDGLEAIVRERLTDPNSSLPARELACELAGLCELKGLQGDLRGVALQPEEAVPLRVDAVRALGIVADDDARRRLLPLARDPLPEDVKDELKGAALRATCPSIITAGEALSALTAQKQPHHTGAYAMFLHRELPHALSDDELAAALAWVRRLPRNRNWDPLDEFGSLSEQILVRGIETMDREDVASAVVDTVADYLRDHHELQSFRTRDTSDALSAKANRRRLVVSLLPLMRDGRLEPIATISSTPRLIVGGDLPWLVEELGAAAGRDNEPVWAELIDWAMRFDDGGVGDRTDIHIDAIAGENVEGARQVTVIVEVKGCWNAELLTAMRTQLADEYLSATHPYGVYLAVWFAAMAGATRTTVAVRTAGAESTTRCWKSCRPKPAPCTPTASGSPPSSWMPACNEPRGRL